MRYHKKAIKNMPLRQDIERSCLCGKGSFYQKFFSFAKNGITLLNSKLRYCMNDFQIKRCPIPYKSNCAVLFPSRKPGDLQRANNADKISLSNPIFCTSDMIYMKFSRARNNTVLHAHKFRKYRTRRPLL